jgi:hypothetical protein
VTAALKRKAEAEHPQGVKRGSLLPAGKAKETEIVEEPVVSAYGVQLGDLASDEEAEEEAAIAAIPGSDDDPEVFKLRLKYNSIRGYVSAIMNLYQDQHSRGINTAPTPHKCAIKAMQIAIHRGEFDRLRREYEDRGVGTMLDGYTEDKVPDIAHQVWSQNLGRHAAPQELRTHVDFLFGHSMLLRLGNRLPLELPDLFSMALKSEGSEGKGWCIVAVLRHGKCHVFPLLFD